MEVKHVDIDEKFRKMYNQDFCEDKLVTSDQSIKQNCDLIIFSSEYWGYMVHFTNINVK